MLLKRMFRKSRRGEDDPEGGAAAADGDAPPASDALRRATTSGPGGDGGGRPRASGLRPTDLGRLSLDGQVTAREVARAAVGAPVDSDADADDGVRPLPRRRRGGRARRVDCADELDDIIDTEGGEEEHGELNGGGRRGGEGEARKANGVVIRDERGGIARVDDDDDDDYDEEEEDLLPEARLSLDTGPNPHTRAVQESERNQNRRLSLDGILPPAAVAPNERGSRGSAGTGRKASSRGSKASSRGSGAAAAARASDAGGGSSRRLSVDRDRRAGGSSSRGRGAEAVMDVDVDALTLPVELGGCSRAGTEPVRGGRSVTEVRKENQVCLGGGGEGRHLSSVLAMWLLGGRAG